MRILKIFFLIIAFNNLNASNFESKRGWGLGSCISYAVFISAIVVGVNASILEVGVNASTSTLVGGSYNPNANSNNCSVTAAESPANFSACLYECSEDSQKFFALVSNSLNVEVAKLGKAASVSVLKKRFGVNVKENPINPKYKNNCDYNNQWRKKSRRSRMKEGCDSGKKHRLIKSRTKSI